MKALLLNIDLFKNIEEKTEKLRFALLLLFVFSLPYDMFYSNIIFFAFSLTTLIDLGREKLRRIPRQVWLFQLIYFLGMIGYFYSLNKTGASFLLERQLVILIFPLIIPLAVKINEEKAQALLGVLTLTSFIAICYLFISMLYTIRVNIHMPLIKTIFSGAFFNHQFSRPLKIHAGYLSLYVSMSVFYTVMLFNKTSVFYRKCMLTGVLIILLAGLFFLASRNTIIATFFILLFIFPLFKTKNKIRYMLVSITCLAACFLVVNNVPYLKKRFSSELITDIKPLKNGSYINYSSAEPRIDRWMGAIDLIKKSPLTGYGTGDEIDLLRTEYIKRNLFISYIEHFNAHNQYLSYLLKNGILGLAVFLLAFIYYLKLAISRRNFMYLAFLLLLLIGFYTENILDANKGIYFFALFNTFFGYQILAENKTLFKNDL